VWNTSNNNDDDDDDDGGGGGENKNKTLKLGKILPIENVSSQLCA
jgi:hypothetical protein